MKTESETERTPIFRLTKKDFIVQTFHAGGPGGQHQNKTASGVRIIHPPSGAVAECRSTRSQYQNKQLAFKRLAADPKLTFWIKVQIGEIVDIEESAKRYAEREINTPEHIEVQVMVDGEWRAET